MPEHPRRSTTVSAPAFRPENFIVFDPDQPQKDPNDLAAAMGGLTDPNEMQHNCPGCHRTMEWELFKAHALPCYKQWRKVAPGWRRHRNFRGATLVTPEPKLVTLEEVR